jgi:hypothetical protein
VGYFAKFTKLNCMFNEVVVCTVDYFKGKGNIQTFDTNQKPNVILVPVAGKIPNQAQVLSGSVAMNSGFLNTDGTIASKLRVVHVTERKADPVYGRQFSVADLGAVEARDLGGLLKEYGKGYVEPTSAVIEPAPNAQGAAPTLNTTAAPAPAAVVSEGGIVVE